MSQALAWHADPGFQALAGATLRPGGMELTERAARLLALKPGSRVLDAGCGQGASVAHLRRAHGLAAVGVDVCPGSGPELCAGRMEALPFASGAFDAVLCECSLCLASDRGVALAEFRRVLRPGGRLALADLFRVQELEGMAVSLAMQGFSLELFEDHSRWLAELASRMVMAGLRPTCGQGFGYGLFLALQRGEEQP